MNFQVKLLQDFPDRPPWAVQARYRLPDGTVQSWPVTIRPGDAAAVLVVESGRDMLVPGALSRSLVAYYDTPPRQEERQISRIQPA